MADKEKTSQPHSPDDQLLAIQQIIVGPALADLKNRLEALEAKLDAQGQEVATLVADTRGELEQQMEAQQESLLSDLQAAQKDLQEQIARINEEKVSRNQMGRLLIELGESLINSAS